MIRLEKTRKTTENSGTLIRKGRILCSLGIGRHLYSTKLFFVSRTYSTLSYRVTKCPREVVEFENSWNFSVNLSIDHFKKIRITMSFPSSKYSIFYTLKILFSLQYNESL